MGISSRILDIIKLLESKFALIFVLVCVGREWGVGSGEWGEMREMREMRETRGRGDAENK
jgi:hypothetical protein